MELSSKPTEIITPEKEAFRKILKVIDIFKPVLSTLKSGDEINKLSVFALFPKVIKKIKDSDDCKEVFSKEFLEKIEGFAK